MYQMHWITDHLATGHAPMSYEDLDSIREQGIRAIVNLCGEFCDLHEIEEGSGFEVYYLPVVDECAPDLEAMEKALDWLDESIYLNKKVLVHCRLGHGRTGTFIAAYLLRRGFDFKLAQKAMKGRNANPATYEQRKFLKRYGKQTGSLQTAAPKIDNRPSTDVAPLLAIYAQLLARVEDETSRDEEVCGQNNHPCCHSPFELHLIESMHLSEVVNRTLPHAQRQAVIDRALVLARHMKELHRQVPGLSTETLAAHFPEENLVCPLLEDGRCLIFTERPRRCLCWTKDEQSSMRDVEDQVVELSMQAFQILTGSKMSAADLRFSSADTISGRFVQLYFQAMTGKNSE
ncbi:protein-tyrosine phosphatase family protein [Desulfobulbus oligotrophicus]|jgi:protein-tyrosine phosphatase|uniref:Dual specificity protein phosphatase family protein n=1 Tax=Desulfobulbus oligotrophicus TaxID=1909699 RepID=A0A7T6AR67_9BACT|nr:dual specificity protein phosphatase family protein [Desulfobulbus oligotrophicus]MDY0389813.1 dual specificity protein phosphatase family protein [Desulfobulbus oligotrophicus]QQG66548.1 dual specificity protein phosphatase family protein [Desulfobulbus oligotrophicus]